MSDNALQIKVIKGIELEKAIKKVDGIGVNVMYRGESGRPDSTLVLMPIGQNSKKSEETLLVRLKSVIEMFDANMEKEHFKIELDNLFRNVWEGSLKATSFDEHGQFTMVGESMFYTLFYCRHRESKHSSWRTLAVINWASADVISGFHGAMYRDLAVNKIANTVISDIDINLLERQGAFDVALADYVAHFLLGAIQGHSSALEMEAANLSVSPPHDDDAVKQVYARLMQVMELMFPQVIRIIAWRLMREYAMSIGRAQAERLYERHASGMTFFEDLMRFVENRIGNAGDITKH